MKKRIISLLLAAAMLVTLMPAAFAAGTYSDTDGHWGEAAIDRWSSYGVIGGYDGNVFVPDGSMTRAEVARVFVNLLGLKQRTDISKYKDVAPSAWYYDDIAKCVAAGILNGDGVAAMNPETPVTREELFTMFARALGVAPKATANKQFIDGNEVSSWAAGYVNALADMGVINGYGGVLSPGSDINRASVMTVLDNAIKTYVTTNGATVGAGDGIVLVVADNVTVTGKVENLVVADSGKTVTVSGGAVDSVTVVGPQDKVIFAGAAAADTVTIPATAEGASVVVNSAAAVGSVVSEADNVTISGAGKVETAAVSGDNTTVNTDGTDLTVAPGTTGVTENSKPVTGGTTVETEPVKNTTPSTPVTPPVYYPTYYTVNFQYTDGTEISTISAVAGSAVTAPEVTLTDGQQVKWHNGTDYVELSNLTVNGNMILTAVVGSDDFTAGDGSETYPYLISDANELYAAGQLLDSQNHFKLCANIDLTTIEASQPDSYGDKGDLYYMSGELNGDGYSIKGKSDTAGIILYAKSAVIKNVNFSDVAHTVVTNATNSTFENVVVSGTFEVGNNTAAFVQYAEPSNGSVTLSFNNCVANVEMNGGGAADNYNAVFVGYAYKGAKTTLTFTNCTNIGSLVCGKAAMFLGNNSANEGNVTINVNNCVNKGEIRSTFVSNTYKWNHFVATGAHENNTVVLDNTTLSISGDTGYNGTVSTEGTGEFAYGPKDTALALTKNSDGTFTVTPATAEGVSYYVVSMSLYAQLLKADGTLEGGTQVVSVSEKINTITETSYTTTLKYLSFVDEEWVTTNSETATSSTEGENTVYTLDGTSYYYFGSKSDTNATLSGTPKAPQMISVSAYDANGNLLCSVGLSN